MNLASAISRRSLLKTGGALIVSFTVGVLLEAVSAQDGLRSAGRGGALKPTEVDSYLAVHQDGTVTIFTSHVE